MLDKIAMITFLVVYIIFLLITIFMYLVIVGTDKCKTDEEREFLSKWIDVVDYEQKFVNVFKISQFELGDFF